MAAVAPAVPQSLPLDYHCSHVSEVHQALMNNQTHMPILNAQQYDLAAYYNTGQPPMPVPLTGQNPPLSPVSSRRARSSDHDDDEAETSHVTQQSSRKKRSRGRPRLDTKDETAADRRRTQIRLAQRAYRHRKDTAITTLEHRVKELEKANDDMSREFSEFYDLLLSERILDISPQAVHRLSVIANRIVSVAERARYSPGEGSGTDDGDEYSVSGSRNHRNPVLQPATNMARGSPPTPMSTHSGFQSSSMQQTNSSLHTSTSPHSAAVASLASAPDSTQGTLAHVPAMLNYEVVTNATPNNTPFPFYPSMEPTTAEDVDESLTSDPSPYETLPVPMSYASHELTFGRRLQRQTAENGLRLVMMSDPPPDRFAAVFGFCLFFESKETIIKRLQLAVSRTQYEDLCTWRVPFTNLGGAGTFFQNQQIMQGPHVPFAHMPIGNQGTRSYGKPQEMTGQSMGPFGPREEATRDERLDSKMQMLCSGFEGEFFDPDEVEQYLRHLGIYIPPRADYVEAEIDICDLNRDITSPGSCSDYSSESCPSSQQPRHPALEAVGSTYSGNGQGGSWAGHVDSPADSAIDASSHSIGTNMRYIDTAKPIPVPYDYSDEAVPFMSHPGAARMWTQPMLWVTKSKVSLDVALLIKELTRNVVCLGRAPCIRKKDVNIAVKAAMGLSVA